MKLKIKIFNTEVPIKSIIKRKSATKLIHERYKKIKDKVIFADNKKTIFTKSNYKLSKGCQYCKKGTWLCLFVGLRCNSNCRFCSRALLNINKDEPKGYQLGMSFSKLVNKILNQKIEGISYSGGEPLLYLEKKVIPIAMMINKKKPSIYQWIYTNGKLINKKNLIKLKKAGIKEVRIDLAATNFDKKIIAKIPIIKEIIGKVTVEIPSIPEVYKKLIKEKLINKLIDYDVEQINLAELYIKRKKAIYYIKNKDIYYDRSRLSPIESRNITIDIIEYAIKNNLKILINDCSNDAKDLQIKKRRYAKGLCRIYS